MRACVRRSGMRGCVGRFRSLCRGRNRAGTGAICHCWLKRAARTGGRFCWRRMASRRAALWSFSLAQYRSEGFDLARPPLIRFALIRLAADQHRLVLTHHHLLMDGWSLPVLVRELFTLYAHKGDCAVLPRVTPYRDYLAWIAAQDRAAALSAWRAALAGLEQATRVAPPDRARKPVAPERITVALSEAQTTALTRQARKHGLTLNTFMTTAWAILLGR